MRVRTLWLVLNPRGAAVADNDGACAWARRADAIEVAARMHAYNGTTWEQLRQDGWRLQTLPL